MKTAEPIDEGESIFLSPDVMHCITSPYERRWIQKILFTSAGGKNMIPNLINAARDLKFC